MDDQHGPPRLRYRRPVDPVVLRRVVSIVDRLGRLGGAFLELGLEFFYGTFLRQLRDALPKGVGRGRGRGVLLPQFGEALNKLFCGFYRFWIRYMEGLLVCLLYTSPSPRD